MICTQCGRDIPGGTAACPACGARLAAHSGQGITGQFQPAHLAERAVSPAFRLDLSRLTNSDRVTGISTVLLLVSLFLPWYGVNILGISAEADGLTVHGYLYIVLLLCAAIIAYLVLRAGFEELPVRLPLSHEQRLLAATGLNAAMVLLAFVLKPDGTSWRFGAFAGLLAALIALAPLVIPAVQARRTRA